MSDNSLTAQKLKEELKLYKEEYFKPIPKTYSALKNRALELNLPTNLSELVDPKNTSSKLSDANKSYIRQYLKLPNELFTNIFSKDGKLDYKKIETIILSKPAGVDHKRWLDMLKNLELHIVDEKKAPPPVREEKKTSTIDEKTEEKKPKEPKTTEKKPAKAKAKATEKKKTKEEKKAEDTEMKEGIVNLGATGSIIIPPPKNTPGEKIFKKLEPEKQAELLKYVKEMDDNQQRLYGTQLFQYTGRKLNDKLINKYGIEKFLYYINYLGNYLPVMRYTGIAKNNILKSPVFKKDLLSPENYSKLISYATS